MGMGNKIKDKHANTAFQTCSVRIVNPTSIEDVLAQMNNMNASFYQHDRIQKQQNAEATKCCLLAKVQYQIAAKHVRAAELLRRS